MALTDILAERALSARATATVNCGELGELTVEALPLRDAERYAMGGDGDRGLVYAACRELQQAGQALFKAGRVRSPMGVMDFVSEGEIEQAAETVRRLSGVGGTAQPSDNSTVVAQKRATVRPQSVQEESASSDAEPEQSDEIRLAAVQENGGAPGRNRPLPVQTADEAGQVSRETAPETADYGKSGKPDRKSQGVAETVGNRTQNLVAEGEEDSDLLQAAATKTDGLHETTSEIGAAEKAALHETKSEFPEISPMTLHETKSELKRSLREIESESADKSGLMLHETTSDLPESPHETRSELPDDLHETESELAERVARRLLEGLRQAAWVR